MCGIFGIISQSTMIIESDIDQQFKRINKRGPDSSGIYKYKLDNINLVLGHTRLSIVDLTSHGAQPMIDSASGLVINFNGEIYNFKEIKRTLKSVGIEFLGNSDTEVLLKGWAYFGEALLPRLNGMFAFSIFNPASGDIWLVRDRFGVKPLYYGQDENDQFIFSSSNAAVAGAIKSKINIQYCRRGLDYKVFDMEGDESPFLGVKSLLPGSFIKFNIRNPELNQLIIWYDLATAVEKKAYSLSACPDKELVNMCIEMIEDALFLRLSADVPVSISLSSGIDSSLLASIATQSKFENIAFCFGSPLSESSEGYLASRFANSSQLKCEYVSFNNPHETIDLARLFEKTLYAQEAPFSGYSVLAQYYLYERVSEYGFKVLIGGQGADEGFAGYRKFILFKLMNSVRNLEINNIFSDLLSLVLIFFSEIPQISHYFDQINRYIPSLKPNQGALNFPDRKYDLMQRVGLLERQIQDYKYWSLPTLLRYEDRNSMANSVESRLPYLDYRLVEFALALPERLKIKQGYCKWIIRAASRSYLPRWIGLNRSKRGFDLVDDSVKKSLNGVLVRNILENKNKLDEYLIEGVEIDKYYSEEGLFNSSKILDEAILLNWLINPLRSA